RVLGDDGVLEGERAGRTSPEDAAAVGGEVAVDGVVGQHQAAGEGGRRRLDAAAVGGGGGGGVAGGGVGGGRGVGGRRAGGPGAGGLDLDAPSASDRGVVDDGAGLDGNRAAVEEQAAAGGATGVTPDGGVGNRRARPALLDAAAVHHSRVVKEEAVRDDQ